MTKNTNKAYGYSDWEEATIFNLDNDFFMTPAGINSFREILPPNKHFSNLKKVELDSGELAKIREKQRDVFKKVCYERFLSLWRNLMIALTTSNDPFELLNRELETYSNLIYGFSTPLVIDDDNYIVDLGTLQMAGSKITRLREAISLLEEGIVNYSIFHPELKKMFIAPNDDIQVESQSDIFYHKWLVAINNEVKVMRASNYNKEGFNIETPSAKGYLNLIESFFLPENYSELGLLFDKFWAPGQTEFNPDFKVNMLTHYNDLWIFHFKKLLKNSFDNAINEFSRQTLISESFSQLKKIMSLCDEYFSDNLPVENEKYSKQYIALYLDICNLMDIIEGEYQIYIIKKLIVKKPYKQFEKELLIVLKIFNSNFSLHNKLPQNSGFSEENLDLKLDAFKKEFEFSLDVFMDRWLETKKRLNPKLNEQSYFIFALDYLEKNFLTIDLSSSFVVVNDSQKKTYTFATKFFRNYALPFFNCIKQILLKEQNKLNQIQKLHTIKPPAKSKPKVPKTKTVQPLYNNPDFTEKQILNALSDLYSYFILTQKLDVTTSQDLFTSNLTSIAIIDKISWQGDIRELRYFIFRLKDISKTKSNWKLAATVFNDKDGNSLSPRQLSSSNSLPEPDDVSILEKAIKILKKIC